MSINASSDVDSLARGTRGPPTEQHAVLLHNTM